MDDPRDPASGGGPERRQTYRVGSPQTQPGRFVGEDRDGLRPVDVELCSRADALAARLVDVSLGGMGVLYRGERCPVPGDALRLRLAPLGEERLLEFLAVVRYRKQVGPDAWRLGLELRVPVGSAGLEAEEALRRYVIERQRLNLKHRAG
jgi:c-di-GMP-binding flagellar brake protein YcgR